MSSSDSLPTSNRIAIEIAEHLKVPASVIVKFLKVKIGDGVLEGTVLASKKKSLLGFTSIEIKSPIVGTIAQVDDLKGVLLIDIKPTPELTEEVGSIPVQDTTPTSDTESSSLQPAAEPTPEPLEPVPSGTFHRSRKSVSDTNAVSIPGVAGFGIGTGEGAFITGDPASEIIIPELRGKILLVAKTPSLAFMFKASAVGVEAVVTVGIDTTSLEQMVKELEGKAQIGLLVVSEEVNLKALNHKNLHISGKEKRLDILK